MTPGSGWETPRRTSEIMFMYEQPDRGRPSLRPWGGSAQANTALPVSECESRDDVYDRSVSPLKKGVNAKLYRSTENDAFDR